MFSAHNFFHGSHIITYIYIYTHQTYSHTDEHKVLVDGRQHQLKKNQIINRKKKVWLICVISWRFWREKNQVSREKETIRPPETKKLSCFLEVIWVSVNLWGLNICRRISYRTYDVMKRKPVFIAYRWRDGSSYTVGLCVTVGVCMLVLLSS